LTPFKKVKVSPENARQPVELTGGDDQIHPLGPTFIQEKRCAAGSCFLEFQAVLVVIPYYHTVDGRNPAKPPRMCKSLLVMG